MGDPFARFHSLETLGKLRSHFKQALDFREVYESNREMLEIRELEGCLGVFATEDIAPGVRILAETVIMGAKPSPNGGHQCPSQEEFL